MTPRKSLNAVTDKGWEPRFLARFFRALAPMFADRPDEIRIEQRKSKLQVRWDGKNAFVPLKTSLHGYAADAFLRILILSGMSIALEGVEQTGKLRVRYGQQVVPIRVASRRDDGSWYLVFWPVWKLQR